MVDNALMEQSKERWPLHPRADVYGNQSVDCHLERRRPARGTGADLSIGRRSVITVNTTEYQAKELTFN